jgi:signal transduction histidine kinase
LLVVLTRALELERAALMVEEEPGGRLLPAAVHGPVASLVMLPGGEAPGGPWSAVLPVGSESHVFGTLLVARPGGTALLPADQALAGRFASAAANLLEHGRLTAEVARAQELLARADRLAALGTLAAGVAHEIRNPLVSVRTFIQLLPERLADEEFRTNFRDLALSEIERICTLITDLLAFSRPAPVQREPADLTEIVGQIVRLLEPEARRHDVVMTCKSTPDLPMVVVDEAQVKQVLMNLLLNAIQACGGKGRVEAALRADMREGQQWVVVTVADSGPGIPPELAEQIFDPFFTTKDAGSGLGLFIAHQIVTEHGGYIATVPRDEGGAVFAINFPARAWHPETNARSR